MCSFSHGHRRKAGRELQTELDRIRNNGGTLSEKSAGAGHRAVSLHRDCVLVLPIGLEGRATKKFCSAILRISQLWTNESTMEEPTGPHQVTRDSSSRKSV